MTTVWKWRIFLFVRAADATYDNLLALGQIIADASGEPLEDQIALFENAWRYSLTGYEPAQVYATNLVAKSSMRDQFKAFLDTLTNARYAVVANTTLPNYADGELVLTNFPVTPNGQIVTWQDAVQYLENQFGMFQIDPENPDPPEPAPAPVVEEIIEPEIPEWSIEDTQPVPILVEEPTEEIKLGEEETTEPAEKPASRNLKERGLDTIMSIGKWFKNKFKF